MRLAEVLSEAEAAACFPLMRVLRPHLADGAEFVTRWQRQRGDGYRLTALWRGAAPLALAGWRVQENLVRGRFLYVDDLVTDPAERSHGHGERLLAHLTEEARAQGCTALTLDTPMDNARGQRFYFRCGLYATALRFAKVLKT